jgi:hypothetical protein
MSSLVVRDDGAARPRRGVVALRLCAAVAVVALAALVGADLAVGCTCADRDERDRLQAGEIGMLGRILDRAPRETDLVGLPGYRYRVRVVRSANARLPGEIELEVPDDGCGPGLWEDGERAAAFVRRRAGGWRVESGCGIVDPDELERAFRPYPRPLGRGRVALLAAGRFGTARVMAIDLRGRILGYGFGGGEARQLSVCPGSRLAAELVARGRELGVAIRELQSLGELRYARLPVDGRAIEPGRATVRCNSEDAASVHAEVRDYLQHRRFDRVRLFRISGTAADRIATVRGYSVALATGVAYVADSNHLSAVNLTTGASRRLTTVRAPQLLGVSPDHDVVALFDRDGLRLVNALNGAQMSRKIRYGEELVWLGPDRFLFRAGGEGRIYDTRLELLRRYRFYRAHGQALVGQRLFGTDRFRLRELLLESGRRQTVGMLPDRGILNLVGVPGRPPVETERRVPERSWLRTRPASASTRADPCSRPRNSSAARGRGRPTEASASSTAQLSPQPDYQQTRVHSSASALRAADARVVSYELARHWRVLDEGVEKCVVGVEPGLPSTTNITQYGYRRSRSRCRFVT